MNAPPAGRTNELNPLLKLALDLGPLLLFFFVNTRWGIYAATGAFMAATVVSIALTYALARRIPIGSVPRDEEEQDQRREVVVHRGGHVESGAREQDREIERAQPGRQRERREQQEPRAGQVQPVPILELEHLGTARGGDDDGAHGGKVALAGPDCETGTGSVSIRPPRRTP